MEIQGDYGNPVHGVSQQPDSRMFKGQCRKQINFRSNLTKGIERRAGFELVGKLTPISGSLDNALWKLHERGDGISHLVGYGVTTPHIFTLDAKSVALTADADSLGYYQSNNSKPIETITDSNILDTTFVVNKSVIPTGTDAAGNDPANIAYLKFKTFQPGTEINITVGDKSYITKVFDGFVTIIVDKDTGKQTPDAGETARTAEYTGAYHAEKAATALGGSYFNEWVRIDHNVDTLVISKGGEGIEVYYSTDIDAIEKLPPVAKTGDVCRIVEGAGQDRSVGYFEATRKGEASLDSTGPVSWTECARPNATGSFNTNTMPHVLDRKADGTFEFKAYTWSTRDTGDPDTNPISSFVADKTPISAVGIFQDRLFLASNETIALSASDDYGNLWMESAFYNTDADPFELYADTEQLNVIKYAGQFDGDLIFFSDNGQFVISGDKAQTYSDSSIKTASQYKADLLAEPVISGDDLLFATNYGNYAGVREFYTDSYTSTKRARPVTDHVDTYMKGRIRNLTTTTNLDALQCLIDSDRTEAYVYEWRWKDQQRQQQAWSKWKLHEGYEFEWTGFKESTLYAVIKSHTGDYYLWKVEWDDPPVSQGVEYSVRLDGRFAITPVYDPAIDMSTFKTPYADHALVFVEGQGSEDNGFIADATSDDGSTWNILGDYSGITLIGGLPYESRWGLSKIQVRDRDGVSQRLDRLQLGSMTFHFTEVGQVAVDVIDNRNRKKTIKYNNRRMNRITNRMSHINTKTSDWSVAVRRRQNDVVVELFTSDPTPCVVNAVEWTAEYNQEGRRV